MVIDNLQVMGWSSNYPLPPEKKNNGKFVSGIMILNLCFFGDFLRIVPW